MPEPYPALSFAIMGESHGVGVGAAGFAGPAGLAAGGVAGAVAAGFAATGGVAGAVAAGFAATGGAGGAASFSGGVFTSACTEPDTVAFTPLATAGLSAVGFGSPSGGGVEGDLGSSGIAANAQTYGSEEYRRER